MKTRYKEECNEVYALVELPKINQEEVEALKAILWLVLVALKLLLGAVGRVSWYYLSLAHAEHMPIQVCFA